MENKTKEESSIRDLEREVGEIYESLVAMGLTREDWLEDSIKERLYGLARLTYETTTTLSPEEIKRFGEYLNSKST